MELLGLLGHGRRANDSCCLVRGRELCGREMCGAVEHGRETVYLNGWFGARLIHLTIKKT